LKSCPITSTCWWSYHQPSQSHKLSKLSKVVAPGPSGKPTLNWRNGCGVTACGPLATSPKPSVRLQRVTSETTSKTNNDAKASRSKEASGFSPRSFTKPEVKERLLGSEAIQGASEATIGPDGLTDAGKFDTFFLHDNKPREDGLVGRFRVFGASASFGEADKKSREKTVQIAAQALGPHMRVEEAPHMAFS